MTTPAEINRRNREFYGQEMEPPMPDPYERRFVAYIDILGWKEACGDPNKRVVVAAVARKLSELPESFSRPLKDRLKATQRGVVDLDHLGTEVVTFSDNLAISTPASADYRLFFKFLSIVCRDLLTEGFLARGGVTLGKLYHRENMIFGPALIDAVNLEQKEAIYPRLLCSSDLVGYMEGHPELGPDSPKVIVNDQLGRHIVNLLAFASRSNPAAWHDLEGKIAETIDGYQRNGNPQDNDVREKNLEKWRFMRDVLRIMIQNSTQR
jgi:hypothetical protein